MDQGEKIMKKQIYVGVGTDGATPIVSGAFIFQLIDSIGLPLDIVVQELKEKCLAFDMVGFIQAAKDSTNYTTKRLKALFNENRPINDENFDKLVDLAIRVIF
jgi:alanyl-tRNA synthetase